MGRLSIVVLLSFLAAFSGVQGCKEKYVFDLDRHIGICGADRFEAAKACGLDYLEVSVSRFINPEGSEDEFAARKAFADTCGLPVYSANGFFPSSFVLVGPDADLERAVRYSEIAIRRASELGIKVLVLGSGRSRMIPEGFDRPEAEEQFVSLLKGIAPFAEKYGIMVAIEPLQSSETNFINTVKEGAELARRADSPEIGVIADFFHMQREQESPDDIMGVADKLAHCHVAECEERTAPGVMGDDFTPFFRALKAVKYKGRISFECKWGDLDTELPVAVQVLEDQINSVK